MTDRSTAQSLLEKHISSPSLRRHCQLVAWAMEHYAQKLQQNTDEWYITGLLHDIDWESHPEEHPNFALANILPQAGLTDQQLQAIAAHGPDRTGVQPESLLDKYLFACDELSGFIDAVAKIRPNGFADLEWKSVKKRLKDSHFAAGVSRADVQRGAELIELPLETHVTELIHCFRNQT